jgi:hypothetical protein
VFGNNKAGKLPGPSDIPTLVKEYLLREKKLPPNAAEYLKAVVKKDLADNKKKAFFIRIFDEADSEASRISIKDYSTLEAHPGLIIFDGIFDETSKKVDLTQKKDAGQSVQIFTYEEILSAIEALTEPGSTLTVFMARGVAVGGPLGRGCAIVELTPSTAGAKTKKYSVYMTGIVNDQPLDKGSRLFDSDSAREVAKWVKEGHHERTF